MGRPEGMTITEWVTSIAMRTVGSTPEKGALSQLYLATSPEVEERDLRGRYFVPVAKEAKPGMFYILWKFIFLFLVPV